jgi:hypothetical protein
VQASAGPRGSDLGGSATCDLAVLSTSHVEAPTLVNRSLFGRLTRAPEEASAVTMGYPR